MPQDFQYIKLPDGSYGKFAANAPDEVIRSAIAKDFPDAFKAAATPSPMDVLSKATGLSAGPQPKPGLPGAIDALRQKLQQRVTTGSQAGAGEFMASAPLGALRMAKGGAELASSPWKAAKDIVGGGVQAATMPSLVMGLEAAESGVSWATEAIPSTQRAGKVFETVKSAVGTRPVAVTEALSRSMSRVQELDEAGGQAPKAARRLLAHTTDPDKGPLTFNKARDIYVNLTRISAEESKRSNRVMKYAISQLTNDLGEAIASTADKGGQLAQHLEAMNTYNKAAALRDAKAALRKFLWRRALPAAGAGAAAGAGYEAFRRLAE